MKNGVKREIPFSNLYLMNKTTTVTMAEEKADTENEEQRLRERLKRRKEDRARSNSQDKRPRRPHHNPPPPRVGGVDRFGRGPPPGRNWRGPPPRDWRGPAGSGPPFRPGPRDSRPPGRWKNRGRPYSRSRSRSRGRSRSSSRSSRSYSSSDDDSRSRSRSADSRSTRSGSVSSSSASAPDHQEDPEAYALTKDQRTVFVSQLVMRADERDVRRFFRRKIGVKVNDVVMLRDKRSGRHKGFCYVELSRLEDVIKAVALNNIAPDFQRFPILIKASEAEKNYTVPSAGSSSLIGKAHAVGPNGKIQEAQKAYVGNLDPSVTQEHIRVLFSSFGTLDKVMLQTDPSTGLSKGFCFLSYRDAKDANLAIQTMSGQTLAGRPLKTGWANQTTALSPNVEYVTTIEFPDDAPSRIANAHLALAQLAGSGIANAAPPIVPPTDVASTAEAAINAALGLPTNAPVAVQVPTTVTMPATVAGASAPQISTSPEEAPKAILTPQVATEVPPDPKVVGGVDNPTKAILVHNMFDKDEETEPNWEEEIRLDFLDECSKYGVTHVVVMHKEVGGKVYAMFETLDGAKSCASDLAGRWFSKRQLRVEFVAEDSVPLPESKSEPSD